MQDRTAVEESLSEFGRAAKSFLVADCDGAGASFTASDLIDDGFLPASFSDFGLTWSAEPMRNAQLRVQLAGGAEYEKTLLREAASGTRSIDGSVVFSLQSAAVFQAHPGLRLQLAYEEVDNQCVI